MIATSYKDAWAGEVKPMKLRVGALTSEGFDIEDAKGEPLFTLAFKDGVVAREQRERVSEVLAAAIAVATHFK